MELSQFLGRQKKPTRNLSRYLAFGAEIDIVDATFLGEI
jgi:hypothetical protein